MGFAVAKLMYFLVSVHQNVDKSYVDVG